MRHARKSMLIDSGIFESWISESVKLTITLNLTMLSSLFDCIWVSFCLVTSHDATIIAAISSILALSTSTNTFNNTPANNSSLNELLLLLLELMLLHRIWPSSCSISGSIVNILQGALFNWDLQLLDHEITTSVRPSWCMSQRLTSCWSIGCLILAHAIGLGTVLRCCLDGCVHTCLLFPDSLISALCNFLGQCDFFFEVLAHYFKVVSKFERTSQWFLLWMITDKMVGWLVKNVRFDLLIFF